MKLYKELVDAITEEVQKIDESKEFTTRFYKLIENYFDGPCTEPEINDVIEMINTGEDINGN